MTGRLQAAREALERARSSAASALQRTSVGSMAETRIEETQSAIGEALALLQSGPDTSRQSNETGQADSLRIFSDGVRSLAARLPLEEGWLKGLALALEHAARALDAAAEGQGWQDIASAPKDGTHILAVVDGDVRTVAWGKTSHVPLYGFCLADQGVEEFDLCKPTAWQSRPKPPVSASKPEGA